MKLLEKIEFQKYGMIYTVLLGILAYCFLVLHFAAVYWDAPEEVLSRAAFAELSGQELRSGPSTVSLDGTELSYTLSGEEPAIAQGTLSLKEAQTVTVTGSVSGDAGVRLYLDLYAEGYDDPDQETGLVTDGSASVIDSCWELGARHPEEVLFRAYAFASSEAAAGESLTLRELSITVSRRAGLLAPVHLTSLILGILLAVLFGISLTVYLRSRKKETAEIPGPRKGILFGYLKLKLVPKLVSTGGSLTGTLLVINKGNAIRDLSDGSHPVNIGVSIMDAERNMVEQEHARLPIRKSGILKKGDRLLLTVDTAGLEKYAGKGCLLAFTVVQEGVAWDRSTTVCCPIP